MRKNKSHKNEIILAQKWIQDWVNNKVERLDRSVRLTKTKPMDLLPELDSQEAQRAVWESILDLKNTLEFADGAIFTKDDQLQLPSDVAQKISKLKTANEIIVSGHCLVQ